MTSDRIGPMGASDPAARSRRATSRPRATMRSWASWADSSGRSSPHSSAAPEGAMRKVTRRRATAAARRAAAQSGSTASAAASMRAQHPEGQPRRVGQHPLDHGAGLRGVEVGEGAGEQPGLVSFEPAVGHGLAEGGQAFEDLAGELDALRGVGLGPAQ
ncbi:MAG TPA: hypothetical protein VGH76_22780 [Actinomycetospora sp.]